MQFSPSDVPSWLKTLRLHKYSYLFASLSYEEMLELTEDRLAEQGVTKGARHKLALSIVKLQQRYQTLLNLEKDLRQPPRDTSQSASLFAQKPLFVGALDELKAILATPLKPSEETDPQDIAMQFTKVFVKREFFCCFCCCCGVFVGFGMILVCFIIGQGVHVTL